MAGSGVLLMQQGYHAPVYDTEKGHEGQSSLLDLFINEVWC